MTVSRGPRCGCALKRKLLELLLLLLLQGSRLNAMMGNEGTVSSNGVRCPERNLVQMCRLHCLFINGMLPSSGVTSEFLFFSFSQCHKCSGAARISFPTTTIQTAPAGCLSWVLGSSMFLTQHRCGSHPTTTRFHLVLCSESKFRRQRLHA